MGRGCPAGHECCEKVEPPSQCLPVPPASWTGCLWLCQEPGDAHRVLESWQHPGHPASPLGLLCSPDGFRACVSLRSEPPFQAEQGFVWREQRNMKGQK